ncbi:MAG: hypothetical protein EOS76_14585 [Mesorhizobium sp.]|uniref:hypothetical protein n=1 Tax=unclassified Mesorhizobium TaxID=325217 RepID=UPI000F74E51D|nr:MULTISPECIES: hypothetical protein [unclassified Mesorhizobium]RVC79577.1 hypothetical protein EN766_07025 [Mesorhizobium sp. M2A.F.Ca.ET.046.02.1.1]AZO34127.1 hypothetical protein EJ072_06215 [Mesorhizobium sp. M2A.F.Ca.ET.046.03.2.1]AZO71556.1 hypothetical protein EJ067_10595 [Mesorhizobium sp. M1D.F.Ca.ET.043.01.1.1]RWB39366.1 MAG: hypothetical protein EOQ44_28075 [Mesorhizobium sp.]RWE18826.1 MAG: hypothetical protein EOS76_14585 [Mesorhizobium sp.]
MSAYGVADSAQLAILTKALNDRCAKHAVAGDHERERIALKVLALYRRGLIDPDQLSAELEGVAR